MAERIPGNAEPASVEKRMKRRIDNKNIGWETFFLPFAMLLLRNPGFRKIVLATDGGTVGRGCVVLMAGVICKKNVR